MVWSFHLYAGSLLGVPIIVAEVLASFINADERIEGIQIGDHEIKIVNFTDDTTIFWRYITYLNRIQVILKLYEDASSSKINFSKSQALWARSYKNRIDHEIMKISIKILGVNFGNPILNNYKSDKISEVLAKEIHVWNRARLSLRGKNIINNTNRGT